MRSRADIHSPKGGFGAPAAAAGSCGQGIERERQAIQEVLLSDSDEIETLRDERDRFVAFAFCAADILIELDDAHRVVFAAGAVSAIAGQSTDSLVGVEVLSLIASPSRPALEELLDAIHAGRRLEPMVVRLRHGRSNSAPLLVVGYRVPDLGGRVFLSFRLAGSILTGSHPERRTASSLLDTDSFATMAAERMRGRTDGEDDPVLTLVDLENYDDLHDRLDGEAQHELDTSIGACLRANSVDGDSAGELGEGRYGLVHDAGLDMGQLGRRVEECVRSADPKGLGVAVRSATVDMDTREMSEDDAAHALVYTIRNFAEGGDETLTMERLSTDLAGHLQATARRMAAVRRTISANNFSVVYQPIVELKSRKPAHYEALVRFDIEDEKMLPFDFVQLAENIGVVSQLDRAMCGRVIDLLTRSARSMPKLRVAVNLSARSLDSHDFRDRLIGMLQRNPQLRNRLMFEITESMALKDLQTTNAFIQVLRQAGHKVSLDDFGVGAAAFEYLRSLEIDYVKIDGSYVRAALRTEKGGRFLKAMAGLDVTNRRRPQTGGLRIHLQDRTIELRIRTESQARKSFLESCTMVGPNETRR